MENTKKPESPISDEMEMTTGTDGTGVNKQGDAAPAAGETPVLYTKRGTPIFDKGAGGDDAGPGKNSADEESFQKLIEGKYKSEYDASVSKIVQARLKSARTAEETLQKYEPLLQALSRRFPQDASHPAEDVLSRPSDLTRRPDADASAVQNDALAEGKTADPPMVEEGESQRLRRQEAEALAVYPRMDLQKELQNPDFSRLVRSGVPVRTAYEVIHQEQIIRGAMEFTARRVQEKMAAGIRSHSVPLENGISPQTPALTREDVRSKSCREDIKARMRRGERITL